MKIMKPGMWLAVVLGLVAILTLLSPGKSVVDPKSETRRARGNR
jgi:hypothetical protein